ncbi:MULTISPECIES: DUF1275 family protein [Sphingomonadaceae]|jgi:uncharacterized membrane protein YoaK (UPF0700 family)|uniref:DUF1275 domain-containing protein n=7 Tax=Sphingomonadaceae TaxID=41297 RepID=A0A0S3F165_9SPHN|nr:MULTISPECIES: YoaK family protein [Sphingomonadaceae]ARR56432.1 DUF1275 family protein [Rhizorhabdus wittichii DC-6]ALR21410.1 hypothetical protein ATN00_15035 [Sphingobium baderi]AMG73000.1 Membrane protein [Sphingopyxis granuli]AMK18107.1 hypothetical protein K663_08630 [Sphingobium sp. MI1205]KEQ55588.1 Membrane protein [Sphingobium chlorophenolicum]
MSEPDRTGRRPSSLDIGRAQRALVQLAAMLAALAGAINAAGFLAFGHVFLASPEANATVLGTSLPGGFGITKFVGGMIFSFVGGVVLTTLITHWLGRYRRTIALVCTAIALAAAYLTFLSHLAIIPAVLIAMAMGSAHCTFERDDPDLQEAISPSTQVVRFGEALAGGRHHANYRQLGLHASFWLVFLIGGLAGAVAWITLDARAFAVAALVAALLAMRAWLIERDLFGA